MPSTARDLVVDKSHLVTSAEEGSLCVVTLLLTGRATPYLHNGVIYVGDEDHYVNTVYILFLIDIIFYIKDLG